MPKHFRSGIEWGKDVAKLAIGYLALILGLFAAFLWAVSR